MFTAFSAFRARARKQSVSRKLTLTVVTAVLAAVAVIAAGVIWQEAHRHTQARLDYLHATAAVFASSTSRAVAAGDAHATLVTLRGVARAPGLIYARITRADGSRLAEIGSGVALNSDARADGHEDVSPLAALRSRTLAVSQTIVQGGAPVGVITLVADNSDLAPTLWSALARTLVAALAALAIGVAVAARLKRDVVASLLRLTDVVRRISQSHDYTTRVDIESDDEVGELCGGFNAMLGEIRDRESHIIELAFSDAETDLPNRHAFERAVAERLAAPDPRPFAVAAIGVDRFQYVRSAIGHALANDLLAEIGARVVETGHVARISTDVIGVLLDAADADELRQRAAALLLRAEEPVMLGENTIDIALSVGLAIHGIHADNPQALIERASIALDQAYATRVKTAMFDEVAFQKTTGNVSLMGDLMRALDNGELSLHLQPKVDLRAGAITGAEMLARWRHPQRGMVPPDLFVAMAEDTGAIGVLTEWSLRQAIACQKRLAARGLTTTLAVNLSGRLLSDSAFIAIAVNLLGQRVGDLFLEITETATIDNQDRALQNINALVAAGAFISIDDYGAGLSSLSYLRRIPAHELKIDKTFVQLLGEQQRDALLVKSTIDLAHSLGMKVTAEGVETEIARAALATMGCDTIQGYLIARPMPEEDFVAFLLAQAPACAATA